MGPVLQRGGGIRAERPPSARAWMLLSCRPMAPPRVRTCTSAALVLAATCLGTAPAAAEDTWSTPHPGMSLRRRTTGQPNTVHVLVVDLCTPGVGFRATASGERRQRTSTWASSVGVEAAVNGDFFTATSTFGLSMGGGSLWP